MGDLHDLAGLFEIDGDDGDGERHGDPFDLENVRLTTVGIDIGSSTSHFMISKVHLQRMAQSLSSRFVLVGREILWRSPITLTPYLEDNTIDALALGEFVRSGYESAGLRPDELDSGAVILTGEALKRKNARALAEALADDSGRFVCASAGHHLEATLAAHGSGAVAVSRARGLVVLNVDIGGGTSKFSLVEQGNVVATAAVEVGGRLAVLDGRRVVTRTEAARKVARSCGARLEIGEELDVDDEDRIAAALCDVLTSIANADGGGPLGADLLLTAPLVGFRADVVTFSGGVAEYLYAREPRDFCDLGPSLARKLRIAVDEGRLRSPVVKLDHGIRATVIGASQFSVALSGNTIGIDARVLPLRNLPVLHATVAPADELDSGGIVAQLRAAAHRLDFDADERPPAVAIAWSGDPTHHRLRNLASSILDAVRPYAERGHPLVVLVDRDIARSLHRILATELGATGPLVCLDGVALGELDYVDIGQLITPAGVVPVVVKSLLFSEDREPVARRS